MPCVLAIGLAQFVLGAAELTGRVVDVTGGPVHATKVELRREGDSAIFGTVLTDLSGRFQFANLAADSYQLRFTCIGFLPARVVRTISAGEVMAVGDVVLQIGPIEGCPDSWERPTILLREIQRGAELSGKAEERGGTPLRRAAVTLKGRGRLYRTSADADGLFSFTKIKPGLYTLQVVQTGFAGFVIEGIRVRDRHRSEVLDALRPPRCPEGLKCTPVDKVLKVNVCL